MTRRLTWVLGMMVCATALPAAKVSYFFGEVKVTTAEGTSQGSTLALAKRTVDKNAKAIVEQIVHIPAREKPESHINVMKIEGSRFTLKDTDGNFRGGGKLFGKPWQWDRSEATAELKNGQGFFQIKEHFTSSSWVIRRRFFDDKGRLKLTYFEERKPISEAMYDLLVLKLVLSPANLGKDLDGTGRL